jgi:hypothetical protein
LFIESETLITEMDIPEGAVGKNFAKALFVIATVLTHWCDGCAGRAREMEKVTFDKLPVLICRMWNYIYAEERKKCKDKNDVIITFPFPDFLKEFHGTRGRGLGIKKQRGAPPKYLVDFLLELKDNVGINPLVRINGDKVTSGIINISITESTRPKLTCFEHTKNGAFLIITDKKEPPLTESEANIVNDIGKRLVNLEDSEVYAIGTHCSVEQTLDDVLYEYHSMYPCWRRILALIESHDKNTKRDEIERFTKDFHRFVKEAMKKASSNQSDYKEAFNKFSGNNSGDLLAVETPLGNAFFASFMTDEIIWGDINIKNAGQITESTTIHMSDYLSAIVRIIFNPDDIGKSYPPESKYYKIREKGEKSYKILNGQIKELLSNGLFGDEKSEIKLPKLKAWGESCDNHDKLLVLAETTGKIFLNIEKSIYKKMGWHEPHDSIKKKYMH